MNNRNLDALRSEVLPYELPTWFDPYALSEVLRSPNKVAFLRELESLSNTKNGYIPFNYRISRGYNKSRTLSIIHPLAQFDIANFYDSNSSLIEYYCSISSYSLRHPRQIASPHFGKTPFIKSRAPLIEMVDEEPEFYSTFFKYNKYPFLYSFFESYEYHRLEKKFEFMLQTDIASFFDNIYTHSISWAIKGKNSAKASIGQKSFCAELDSLMQKSNYKETNGIPIGPEFSRIFAEIIAQKIDVEIQSKLADLGLRAGVDYDIRRYVDDYFMFYNDESHKRKLISVLEQELSHYKLSLNESKTEVFKRPFSSNISMAKQEIRNYLENNFQSRKSTSGELQRLRSPYKVANRMISGLKMVLGQHNSGYVPVSSYIISSIQKNLIKYTKHESFDPAIHFEWILVDLDVVFFVHCMDLRIRTTDKLSMLVLYLNDLVSSIEPEFADVLAKRVIDHIRLCIDIYTSRPDDINGVEILNLLTISSMFTDQIKLPESLLIKYFKALFQKTESTGGFYFIWVTFMNYIKDSEGYSSIRKRIIRLGRSALWKYSARFDSSEYVIFFFDFLSCPFINKKDRKKLGESISKVKLENKRAWVINDNFVIKWNDKLLIRKSLQKKKFVFPYA